MKDKVEARRAYVAIVTDTGEYKVGIAEEGISGYSSIREDSDLGGAYPSYEAATETANECNRRLGLTDTEAAKIIASTMFGRGKRR